MGLVNDREGRASTSTPGWGDEDCRRGRTGPLTIGFARSTIAPERVGFFAGGPGWLFTMVPEESWKTAGRSSDLRFN